MPAVVLNGRAIGKDNAEKTTAGSVNQRQRSTTQPLNGRRLRELSREDDPCTFHVRTIPMMGTRIINDERERNTVAPLQFNGS